MDEQAYIHQLLDLGINVLPLQKDKKAPYHKGWKGRTIEENREFWKSHSVSEYGTGWLLPIDYAVLDLDFEDSKGKKTTDAIEFYERFESELSEVQGRRTSRGFHFYFTNPNHIPSHSSGGIEWLTDTKQVVIFPTGDNPFSPHDSLLIKDLKPAPLAIEELISKGKERRKVARAEDSDEDVSQEKIITALDSVPADDYEIWLEIGMALHDYSQSHPDQDQLQYFIAWSKTSDNFVSELDCRQKWDSFTQSTHGITINSLFHQALQQGLDSQHLIEKVQIPSHMLDLPNTPSEEELDTQEKLVAPQDDTSSEDFPLPYDLPNDLIIPDQHWYDCPAPLGRLTEQVCDIAVKPLAGSTFAALATLSGHIKCHRLTSTLEGLAPVNYFICVAPTSGGKNLPQKIVNDIVEKLNIPATFSDIRTEKSTYKLLKNHPSVLFNMDEVTDLMRAVTASNAESYVQGIPGMLTKLWSYTNRTFKLPATMNDKDKNIELTNPKLSLTGFAQYSCLECFSDPKLLERGFSPRFIFIIEKPYQSPRDLPYTVVVPEAVQKHFEQLVAEYLLPSIDPNADILLEADFTLEAVKAYDLFEKEIDRKIKNATKQGDYQKAAVYGKAVESAKRLAMAICGVSPIIREDLALWCIQTLRYQLRLGSHIADNVENSKDSVEDDKLIRRLIKVWKILYSEDKEVSKSDLRRRSRSVKTKFQSWNYFYQQALDMELFSERVQKNSNKKILILNREL